MLIVKENKRLEQETRVIGIRAFKTERFCIWSGISDLSADPRESCTVLKRTKTGGSRDVSVRTPALVTSDCNSNSSK
jgi:hypothetical protein